MKKLSLAAMVMARKAIANIDIPNFDADTWRDLLVTLGAQMYDAGADFALKKAVESYRWHKSHSRQLQFDEADIMDAMDWKPPPE